MAKRQTQDKVVSLRLPTKTYDTLQKTAGKKDMTVADYMRMLIRLGEYFTKSKKKVYVKDGDEEKELLLL